MRFSLLVLNFFLGNVKLFLESIKRLLFFFCNHGGLNMRLIFIFLANIFFFFLHMKVQKRWSPQ